MDLKEIMVSLVLGNDCLQDRIITIMLVTTNMIFANIKEKMLMEAGLKIII